jgi:predicted nucleic acid-binding protein
LTYLLDTKVISGLRKPQRDRDLDNWFLFVRPHTLHISVITVAEIEKGIHNKRTTDAFYAERLADWRNGLVDRFKDRILPITLGIAKRWGPLAQRKPDDEIDMLIAATALEHDLVQVTRSVADFAGIEGLRVENPF